MVTVGEPDSDCPHCVAAGLVPPPAPAKREDGGARRRAAVRWSQPVLPWPQEGAEPIAEP